MQTKNLCLSGLAASAVLVGTHAASADVLALYDFSEFTSEMTSGYTNVSQSPHSPYVNHASSPLATVTGLDNSNRLPALAADTTRDSTNVSLGSETLLIAAGGTASTSGSNVPPPPVASDDYLGFTVTADQDDIGLTELSFDLGTSVGANTNATSGGVDFTTLEANVQLFYSTDGGATFDPIGSLIENIADNADNEGAFTGMNAFSVDLSSLDLLDTGESVEFRLAFTDNRGGGSGTMGHYLDNVMLEGIVIPEPTSIGLLGLAGAGLLVRRRRA